MKEIKLFVKKLLSCLVVNNMSLHKAIKYGKEHRKEYRGAKRIDPMCRNHGGCKWCEENRRYKELRDNQKEKIENEQFRKN